MDILMQKLYDMLSDNTRLLVHVMGGQDKRFFQMIGSNDGIRILVERSMLGGFLRIFSFIPSREGLIELETKNIKYLVPRLLELNSGVALLEFYSVPEALVGDFEKCFYKRQIQSFLEQTPAVRSIVSEA